MLIGKLKSLLTITLVIVFAYPVYGSETDVSLFGIGLFSDVNEHFSKTDLLRKEPHAETNEEYYELWFTNPPINHPSFDDYFISYDSDGVIHQIGTALIVFDTDFCLGMTEKWSSAFSNRYGGHYEYWEGDNGGIYVRDYSNYYNDFSASIRCNQYASGEVYFWLYLESAALGDSIQKYYTDAF